MADVGGRGEGGGATKRSHPPFEKNFSIFPSKNKRKTNLNYLKYISKHVLCLWSHPPPLQGCQLLRSRMGYRTSPMGYTRGTILFLMGYARGVQSVFYKTRNWRHETAGNSIFSERKITLNCLCARHDLECLFSNKRVRNYSCFQHISVQKIKQKCLIRKNALYSH